MLVFQKSWQHIEDRCGRAGVTPEWLIKIVAEINLYLPDDWRMTRSSDNFRIDIISDHHAALVGHCYRRNEDNILHIIDTVFPRQFFDASDVKAALANKDNGPASRHLKRWNHADAITPNLYYFRPHPNYSRSPLFARQYEKIKIGQDKEPVGDQYHRLHPLAKEGLDLIHSHWIRWTTNGDIQPVSTPDPNYHGKDYWVITNLSSHVKLRGKEEEYFAVYQKKMKALLVKEPKEAEPPPSPYEIEHKFFIPTKDDVQAQKSFDTAREWIQEHGFSIDPAEEDKRAKKQKDVYFDDPILTIHGAGASFRLREKESSYTLTLKKRLPLAKAYSERGLYERIEEETVLTKPQKDALLKGDPLNVLPYRLLFYVAPRCGKLSQTLAVINKRKTILIRDNEGRPAEVCFDKVSYEIDGDTHGPYYEIEIESKGASRKQLQDLANFVEENLGLIPSRQSKYERGISIMKTKIAVIKMEKKKVIIDTDAGVDDALALILAMKSEELDVLAITALSGNVHVDKVILNVLKVLKVLEIKEPPIIARGAEKPLNIPPISADSVHGMDGLGDTNYTPGNYELDRRPAWEVICDLAKKHPKEITIITLGPLTNLAMAIQNRPEDVYQLNEVVAMGGVFFNVGNISPDAEFNVKADPDAAAVVVKFCRDACRKTPVDEKGNPVSLPPQPSEQDYARIKSYKDHDPADSMMVPLTFVGLDVTHQVILRRAAVKLAVSAFPQKDVLSFIQKISEKYMTFYNRNEGLPGCYLHDPLAVAYVINPAFLEVERHIINVETAGQFTSGVIFPDDRPTTNPAWRNPADEVIWIARRVEQAAFEEFIMERFIA